MKYPFRFVILALSFLGAFAIWLFVFNEETEIVGDADAPGLLSDVQTAPQEADNKGGQGVEADRNFAAAASAGSAAEIMEASVPESVPAHMADRFTPEEYAAWKAKRQAAFGGLPLQRTLEDIPESTFRTQLEGLSKEGRANALATFNNKRIPMADVPSLRIYNDKGILAYECAFDCGHDHHGAGDGQGVIPKVSAAEASQSEPVESSGAPVASEAPVAVSIPPAYSSKPGAPFTLYLDFNGGKVSGTQWNTEKNVTEWDFYAWDTDNDTTTFSDSEQTAIYRVWQRMSEDYAPYDINVTTDVAFDPDNNGGRSNSIGIVMFVPDLDKNGVQQPATGGGVAYLGVVHLNNFTNYQPAWVNTEGTGPDRDDFMAAAGSHEFGHNLDLSHDGESGGDGEYYNGHGSAPLTWGPIMGSGYYADMTQWSKGEYLNATNTEDDLVIIETSLQANVSNSIGYRTDDHGDTRAAATALDLTVATINAPATTDLAGDEVGANEGIIEKNTDIDYWSFFSGSGSITINASPFVADNGTSSIDRTPSTSDRQNGTNLDVKLVIYNSSGTVLATADPSNSHAATITHNLASSGTYYISIEGSGWGDPTGAQTGWTDYGSIGQYFLSGSVALPNDPPTDIALSASSLAENEPSGTAVGTLSSTDPDSGDTAAYSLVSGTGDANNAEFQISGTQLQTAAPLDFEAGSTRSVRIRVTDSQGASYEEAFTITVTDADDAPAVSLVWPDTDAVGIPSGVGLVLDATVTDDGFGGSSLTFTWSKVSGPGTVSWDNQNQADTAVTFSADGTYVLRLSAFDGTNTTTQDFTITVGASSGGGLPAPPTPDLHYTFDDGSGSTADDAAGTNDGTLTNGPVWTVDGKRSGALTFDGANDHVLSSNGMAFSDAVGMSATAWVKWGGDMAASSIILAQQDGSGTGRTLMAIDTAGTLISYIGNGFTTGSVVPSAEWVHVGVTVGSNQVRLYINGAEVGSSATTTDTPISSGSFEDNDGILVVGSHKTIKDHFDGDIDDVAFYQRVLTAEEIATLAGVADTTAGPTDSLIGRWQLNDASGATATDDSGNANSGTLNGPIWAAGRWGGALDFDGSNDYVDFGDVNAIDGATALSISLWARFNNTTADHTLVSKSDFAGSATSFMLWRDDVTWVSGRTDSVTLSIGDSSSADIRVEGATGSLGDTGWHHIVVTLQAGSASGLRLYIDGVEDANSPVDVSSISALPISSSPLRLGTSADTLAGKWLNGNLDEVRIYNRVLTPSEVTALGEAAPSNTGPAVEAGGPYTGLISETVALDGTVSDGEGDSVTTIWSQVSGPVSASFGNTAVVDTTVSSATEGSYVLRLTADDGMVKTFDDADLTVALPAGPGELYFESASYSVDENGSGVTIDVRRGGGIDGEVSVTYNTANGSASAGSDYTAVSGGTLTWADQENGLKSFNVTITDDSSNEGDETFTVALSNPTNSATVGSPSSTTVSIVEDDLPPLAASGLSASASDRYQIDLSWTDNSSDENGFKIERSTSSGSGFSLLTTTAANATSYSDSAVTENTEYFYRVTATNAFGDSAPTSEASATTPATANGTLALSSATYSVAENGSSVTITVTRSGGTDDAVAVDYATSNGTAAAGSDYAVTSGTLNWSDTDGANKSFTVNITDDSTYEGDETFTVALSGVTGGASLGTDTSTVTITEDDPIPAGARVTAQSPVSGSEQVPGLTQLTLTFSESMDPTSFVVADDVASFTGGQGTDLSGTITGHSWTNNDTELTITFNALNNEANYRLVVGPDILNLAGWPMDQDQDGNLGEAEQDTYAANLWVATVGSGLVFWSDLVGTDALDIGWTLGAGWATGNAGEGGATGPDVGADGNPIVGTNLSGDYAQGINSYLTSPVIDCSGYTGVTLSFQRWLEIAKGDTASVEVWDGSGWQIIQTIPENSSDGNWIASSFNVSAHADGNASFQIRWGVVEGGQPNQASGWQIDQIEITGNGGTTPPPAPVVVDHSPVGTVVQGVSSLYVNFSQPMDTTSFALGDIDSFSGPAGSITASGFSWVSDTVLNIDFPEESADGLYTLILAPTVLDDWGQALDQDKDATAGESSQDTYTATFTIASASPPAAVSGLSATAASSTQIDLSWTDNSGDETGFKVQQATVTGGPWADVTTTAVDATSYSDTGLSAGTEYFYRVIATSVSGDSAPTTEASATTFTATQQWYSDNGLPTDGSGDGAPGADPDGDGVPNLQERAFGTLPNDGGSVELPTAAVVPNGGSDYLMITYRRLTGGTGTTGIDYTADGITYTVEYDEDLVAPWSSGGVTAVGDPVGNGDGTETVTVRLNSTMNGTNFIRVKVSVP